MAAGGVPETSPDDAASVGHVAIELRERMDGIRKTTDSGQGQLGIRIG